MKKRTVKTLLLFSLGLMLVASAACFPPATPVPPSTATGNDSIQNIVWQWTSVSNRTSGESTSVPNPASYTIIFHDDGTLTGQADCNSFSGTYSQEAGFSISIGPVTMAACGDDSLDATYLELLGSVVAGGPDGIGNLALETAGGEQRMTFVDSGSAME
ncbi:MAG: META domain-containing protein [Anaerolineae bacterium]|nr:META domain-containing protein [Anaerolineae bacterium]